VCVFVCVKERERERDSTRESCGGSFERDLMLAEAQYLHGRRVRGAQERREGVRLTH
jgi:hypothetical protein